MLKEKHVLMQSTGVSFWCLQVQKYKRESIPGPKVGLLGILGKIYFLVNGVGQSLRFASWYPVVSAPQTHTAMRKPRWWHSTTTHQPLRGILWAPLLQFYTCITLYTPDHPLTWEFGGNETLQGFPIGIPGLLMFTFLRKHRGSNCVSLTIRASRPNPNCSHMGQCLWAVVFICRPWFSLGLSFW